MRRVKDIEYTDYIQWAKKNTANQVYPCSIAEGIQLGDIFINDGSKVESVFFWHYCGFGYITGKASDSFLNEIYSEMVSNSNGRRLVLITADDDVMAFFRGKDVLTETRAEYSYSFQKADIPILEDGFQIEKISSENSHRIEGRIVPSFSWESPEHFLKDGFGYVALDHGRVCAVAFSAAVSSDEIDIGVETHEDYRKKGFASLLAGRMCEHIIELGKKPVWAHSTSNKGSMNTAIKCGFAQTGTNTVIRKK